MKMIVSTKGFTKRFGQRVLWAGIQMKAGPGDMIAVRGESGSGKTTLLHCLGALEPFDGMVTVDGADVRRLKGRSLRNHLAHTVSYLFQNYGLVDNWTVARNLDVVRYGAKRGAFAHDQSRVLKEVGLDLDVVHRKTSSLSGGEQQRVSLARVLLKPARLVLADEPTSALDDENAGRLVGLLQQLARDGRAVLVATHDPRVIDACSGEFVLGRVGLEDVSAGNTGPDQEDVKYGEKRAASAG